MKANAILPALFKKMKAGDLAPPMYCSTECRRYEANVGLPSLRVVVHRFDHVLYHQSDLLNDQYLERPTKAPPIAEPKTHDGITRPGSAVANGIAPSVINELEPLRNR